jgi:hypothetical protein
VPQSGAKGQFNSTVYFRTLNPVSKAERVSEI